MKKTTSPPEYNLLAGALFVSVGACISAGATFSHFTIGMVSGGNVRVAGVILMLMGVYLVAGYFKRAMTRLKPVISLAFIFAGLLCSMVAVPFLQTNAGLSLPPILDLTLLALMFVVGHILHKKLTKAERPTTELRSVPLSHSTAEDERL